MTRIWSATAGERAHPDLVLVHGSLDRSAGLLKLSRRLDGEFRVGRYDRRGYGRSRPHDGPFDIAAQVDDLLGVLEVTGVRPPAVLFGHSYGGDVVLATAERRPDLVAAAVVYEAPLSWEPWWPRDTAGGNAVVWQDDPAEAAERFMRRLIGDDRWERLPPATRTARRDEGRAMVGELVDLRRGPAWHADRIAVPVLALAGEHGQPHHRESAVQIGERVDGAETALVAGARHFGPNTHPDAVAELVVDFVRRRRDDV